MRGLIQIKLNRDHNLSESDLQILNQLEYVDQDGQITPLGVELTRLEFVTKEFEKADAIHTRALTKLPVNQAILQSLWGVSGIDVDQVKNSLIYLDVEEDIVNKNAINLLNILNRFKVITYSKKHRSITLLESPITVTDDTAPAHIYIDRTRPFANDYYIRSIIRSASGTLMWLDKYFQKEAFEWLFREADSSKITSIQIVSSVNDNLIDPLALADYKKLKKELSTRGISLEWRTLARSQSHDFHDRWLLDDNGLCYNIPSINSIKSGQRSELHKSPNSEIISATFKDYYNSATVVS